MSLSAKPSSFAVATTSRRAGKLLVAQVAIAVCITSSVIIQSISFGHRNSTSYPVGPATHPALRAGRATGLAGSHQSKMFFVLLHVIPECPLEIVRFRRGE